MPPRTPRPIEDVLFKRIGITPYMLIPHAVLIHNSIQVNSALSVLSTNLEGQRKVSMRGLEDTRSEIERRLNRYLVPSVFRYRTESTILAKGFEESGGLEKATRAHSMLAETGKRIEAAKARHERRFMWGVGFASCFLAGFTYHSVADQFFKEVLIWGVNWEWNSFFAFLACLLLVLAVLLMTKSRVGPRDK